MANKTMHHAVIGDDTFEVIDEVGREEIASLKEDLSESVGDLKSTFSDVDGVELLDFIPDYYIDTSAAIGSEISLTPAHNSAFQYAIAECSRWKYITLNGSSWTRCHLWAFIDSNNILLDRSAGNATGEKLVVAVPTNAAKVIVSLWKSNAGNCFLGRRVPVIEEDLSNQISALDDKLTEFTELKKITFVDNFLINTTPAVGETVDLTPIGNAAFSYAIEDCTEYSRVLLNGVGWTTGVLWAFIDGDGKLISKSAANLTSVNLIVDIPTGASKIIVNTWQTRKGNCYLGVPIGVALEKQEDQIETLGVCEKNAHNSAYGNLLYPMLLEKKTFTERGLTLNFPGDGTIIANGTTTGAVGYTIGKIASVPKNTWCYWGGCPSGASDSTFWLAVDGFGYAYERGSRRSRDVAITNANALIRFASGVTLNNAVFKPYFFEEFSDNLESNNLQVIKHCIRKMYDDSVCISGLDCKIAVTDGFDIDVNGNLFVGCVLGTGASEYDQNVWSAHLILGNIGDIEQTKKKISAFTPNEVAQELNEYYMHDYQWCGAKKISDNEVIVYCAPTWSKDGASTWFNGYVAKVYNLTTQTFGAIQTMTITVGQNTYPLYIKYNTGMGISDESLAEVEAIWEETGIEHGPWYGQEMRYLYYLQVNPVKYDGYWWAATCLGGQSHALCKSSDMLHWTYVCDIPFGQSSEEVAICFYRDYLYATSRGNPSIDSQYSKIMRCPINSLTTASWSTPISLNPCRGERPAIVGIDGYIYVSQCIDNTDVDGVAIPRSFRRIFVFDTDLNILNMLDVHFKYPILHPTWYLHGSNVFSVLSSDKRCYASTSGGDGRSELSFAHIDETLFRAGMKNLL